MSEKNYQPVMSSSYEMRSSSENGQINTNLVVRESNEKKCTKCGETKILNRFSRRADCSGKHHSWCIQCRVIASRKWARDNPEKNRIKTYRHRLKYRYGLSQEQYDKMFTEQNGRCYICDGSSKLDKKLAVDHNHTTGKVRRLLCDMCNKGLGSLRERPDIMERMISYVKEFN